MINYTFTFPLQSYRTDKIRKQLIFYGWKKKNRWCKNREKEGDNLKAPFKMCEDDNIWIEKDEDFSKEKMEQQNWGL